VSYLSFRSLAQLTGSALSRATPDIPRTGSQAHASPSLARIITSTESAMGVARLEGLSELQN